MIDFINYIEVVTAGADDPASVNYDYDLCVQNNHEVATLKVTAKIIYTFSEENQIIILKPQERFAVCTVDGGPTFENCEGVEILAVQEVR